MNPIPDPERGALRVRRSTDELLRVARAGLLLLALASTAPGPAAARSPAPEEGSDGDAAAPRERTMLCLREGDVLWGEIVEHDEEHLAFRRLDTGGLVRLPWSRLDAGQEQTLRLRFGYAEVETEEITVQAERIVTVDGHELIGLIVNRTEDALHVKTARSLVVLPKVRVAGPATLVRVPAFDVYTREELYQRKRDELAGRLALGSTEGARAHFELAQYCERALDYAHAAEHYARAGELDPAHRPQEREIALARALRRAEAQEQIDYLAEVQSLRARGRFDRAFALCDAFPGLYPASPLLEDLAAARRAVERAQLRELTEQVVRSWHFWTSRLAAKAARELAWAETLAYVDEQLGEEVLARVVEDMQEIDGDIAPERVVRLWEEREGGRVRKATYGVGTWLLGEDRAFAELRVEAEEEAPGEKAEARSELEERIRRYLEQQRAVARARQRESERDPAAFWQAWPYSSRLQWILAYYAEFGGDMRLRSVSAYDCRSCAGAGVREVSVSSVGRTREQGAGTRLVPCGTCDRIGIVRRVSYR